MAEGKAPLNFQGRFDGKGMIVDFKKVLKQMEDDQEKMMERVAKKSEEIQKLLSNNIRHKTNTDPVTTAVAPGVVKSLNEAHVALGALSGKAQEAYERLASLRTQSQTLSEAKRHLVKQLKNGEITAEQYEKQLAAIERQQFLVRTSLQNLNRELTQNIKLENVAAGSLEEARIKLAQLERQIITTGGAMDGSNPKIQEMIQSHQKLRSEVEALEHQMGNHKRNVGNYASGWNGLQHSINQISRELPAFAVSAHMGFLAISNNLPILADEIKRVRVENAELTKSGEKGVPVWRRLLSSILSWQTALSLAITATVVYGREIGNWITSLFQGKKAIDAVKSSQESLSKAMEATEYTSAVKSVHELRTNLDLAKDGMLSKKDVVDQYNDSMGRTVGQVKTLAEVEASLVNNADRYVQMMLYKAAATQALEEASKHAVEAAKAMAKSDEEAVSYILSGTQGMMNANTGRTFYEDAADRARTRQAEKENEHKDVMLGIAEDFQRKAAEIFKEGGFTSFFGGDGGRNAARREEQEYRRLMERITDLDSEYARRAMESDLAEQQALRDKFADVRKEIQKFNANPNNKIKITLDQLDGIQERAESQLLYKQQTTALVKELEAQRDLWEDYEAWRLELGEQSANERYANELDVATSFKDRLAQEIASIGTMLTASIAGGADAPKLTGVEEERLKQLQEMMRQIESQEQKRRDDNLKRLYADYASFEQKRIKARARANKDIADLDEDGKKRRLKALEDELAEIYRMEVEGDAELQEFLKVADNAGSAIALRAMKHGKEAAMRLIDGFTKDPQVQARLRKEFAEFFDKGIAALEVENFGNVVQLVEGFDRLVQSAEQFDGTLSTALKTIGSMVSQVGQLAKTLGDTMGELGGNLSKGGGYMAIVGALFSAFGTMINISEARSERVVEHQREMGRLQIQQLDATTRLLERQLQLVQEIYGTERVYSYARVISDTTQTISDGLAEVAGKTFAVYTGTGLNQDGVARFNQEFKGSLAELDAAIKESEKKSKNFWNIVTGTSSTHSRDAMALRKMREAFLNGQQWSIGFDHISDITQEGINEIYEILEKGGLGDVVESQLKNIVEQWELWRDAMNQLNQELTGTTFQSITDEIVGMFREGKTAAEDFANSFEKLMQNAVLQSFKRKYLEEALQGWYDEFAGATESGGGLDEGEVEKLQQGYNSIIESARKGLEEMQKVTGTNIGAGQTQNQGELSRNIAGITETTANRLEAEFGGLRLAQLQLLEFSKASANQSLAIMNSKLAALNRIDANTGRTADNTSHLSEIRAAIVQLNNKITNTDSLLRGAGLR